MKTWLLLVLFVLASITAVALAGADNKGTENISIDGGTRGPVPFPHHAHQERLKDCAVCHSDFPQEADALNKLKQSNQLKPKQVMNALYIHMIISMTSPAQFGSKE